jgi:hypothetical protein
MWVPRPVSDSEPEELVLVDRKGKRKEIEPPKRKVKVEKKTREKAEKLKASGSKSRAKRPAPKSTPKVPDTSEDGQEVMVLDDESGEEKPKPKRARVASSKSPTHLFFLFYYSFLYRFQRGPCPAAHPARGAGEIL